MPTSAAMETDRSRRVELSLAADAQMLFLARMTGAAVATRAEFDYEQVEDLRLAIDELCIALMRSGSGSRLSLVLEWDDKGTVEVSASLLAEAGSSANGSVAPALDPGPDHELSTRILEALVDEHGETVVGGAPRGWFRMKRQRPLA